MKEVTEHILQDGPPTSYTLLWGNCQWPYKWVTGVITPISGVPTLPLYSW